MKTQHHHQNQKKLGRRKDEKVDKLVVDQLPTDLEVEILARLPAKSLMKVQCVSKMWSSIIRSQRFVDSFYALSSTRSRFTVTFCNADAERLFIYSSSFEEEERSLVAKLQMTIPSVDLIYGFKSPSVHGFLGCCSGDQFIVCNPTTRQVISLPIKTARASLGYDPVGRQFKALNLVSPPDLFPAFLVHEAITFEGGGGRVSRKQVTSAPYYPVTDGLYINGSIYYAAWARSQKRDPVVVCFDVRSDNISFIKAPWEVVACDSDSILIDYRGKLASIIVDAYSPFQIFGLWILEDALKHEWSNQTFELPFPLLNMTSPGTNKAGDIIFAPTYLPPVATFFFLYYYNVENQLIRSVRLHGVADDEDFQRRYGLLDYCYVNISPEHVESIASL
ncbi:PREDICTED: F-box protein At1g30790-like [Camelina sativa]|uniref:F-box protein At1g30790-like n=1 Tax=Camelina sativa TaxID=90675 RepID=A0ABM0TXF7_CAMSA|nr:PREDICTED: F-box protein At1g30790-like [Camelina sativa]